MLQPFFPPEAYMEALHCLFPTVQWQYVSFFSGIPRALDAGQPAITLQQGAFQKVYMRDVSDICASGTGVVSDRFRLFLTLAHECVHVLQIQSASKGSWLASYSTCFITGGFTYAGNCFEQEALSYANRLDPANPANPATNGFLQAALANNWIPEPFICWNGVPQANPLFCQAIQMHPDWQKTSVSCSYGSCLGSLLDRYSVAGILFAAPIVLISAAIALATLIEVNIGTWIGAALGVVAGVAVGVAAGASVGVVVGVLVGFLAVLFFAALLALIVSAIVWLFDTIFGGDSGGGLNVVFSTNGGVTFDQKITFEKTREQFAAILRPGELVVGWTGLDDSLDVIDFNQTNTGSLPKFTFENSNHCGPALAFSPVSPSEVVIAWQGNDNRLNFRVSISGPPGLQGGAKFTFDDAVSDPEATPSLAFGFNGFLYFSWIDRAHEVHLFGTWTIDGSFKFKLATGLHSIAAGTPALAVSADRLFLARVELDQRVLVAAYSVLPDGSVQFLSDTPIDTGAGPELSHNAAGPSAVFDSTLGRLFVSWIAPNQSDIVLASSLDGISFSGRQVLHNSKTGVLEQSRGNCGPALTSLAGGLGWGWTGRG